jgi:hypothetical protein
MPSKVSTPKIGELLPRANEAHTTPEKLEWMLAAHGHGPEWARVFRLGSADAVNVWSAIAQAIIGTPISSIRDAGLYGVSCEVRTRITIQTRTAPVLTAWHYSQLGQAPRLVTAFPTP